MDDAFFKRFGGAPTEEAPAAQGAPADAPPSAPAATDPFEARFGKGVSGSGDTINVNHPSQGDMARGDPTQDELKRDTSGDSPINPIDISPASAGDRAALSVGNMQGSIAFLKKQYDDVKYVSDRGLVVQKNGKWHQIDPSLLGGGDPWQRAKELGKDAADLTDTAVDIGTYGAATLASGVTAGLGSVAAAGGAGMASKYIKTSMGRALGTYEATDEERIKDIVLEGVLNMGGQTLALGMKPRVKDMTSGLTTFTGEAHPVVKDSMAKVIAATTDVQEHNAKRLMDRAPQIAERLNSAAAAGGEYGTEAKLKLSSIDTTKKLLDKPWKALSARFESEEGVLLSKVPTSFTTSPQRLINSSMEELVSSGVVVPKVGEGGKVLYRLGDEATLTNFFGHPEGGAGMQLPAKQSLVRWVKLANDHVNSTELKGAEGVKAMLNIRRTFDKFYYDSTAANEGVKELLGPASSRFRTALVNDIHNVSPEVAQAYGKMNATWVDNMPFAAKAQRILNTVTGPETAVNQLSTKQTDNLMLRETVRVMSELKGKAGQGLRDHLEDGIAAQEYYRLMPRASLKKAGVVGGALLGASQIGLGTVGAGVGLAAAPLTSPRLVLKGASAAQQMLPYAQKFADFVRGLQPQAMQRLTQDPQVFDTVLRTTIEGAQNERQLHNQLLNESGVGITPGEEQ